MCTTYIICIDEIYMYIENSDHKQRKALSLYSAANVVNLPSLSQETITKEVEVIIEVDVSELRAAIATRNVNKVYYSSPFPFHGKGLKFQLHLYPTNFEHTHSVLYLVMVNWCDEEIPSELLTRVIF